MKDLNEIIEFDTNSLVYVDTKTKGCKTLQKMLDKRNVKWTNDLYEGCTHLVCTRLQASESYVSGEFEYNSDWDNVPDDVKQKYYKVQKHNVYLSNDKQLCCFGGYYNPSHHYISYGTVIECNGIPKFTYNDSWDKMRGKRIYSYNEFKRILENNDRTELKEDNGTIIELLKTADKTNIELAVTLIEQYKMDPKWIPWLLLNRHNNDVRKLLRKLNVKYSNTYSSYYRNHPGKLIQEQKRKIKELIDQWQVPKDYAIDFIKELYEYE